MPCSGACFRAKTKRPESINLAQPEAEIVCWSGSLMVGRVRSIFSRGRRWIVICAAMLICTFPRAKAQTVTITIKGTISYGLVGGASNTPVFGLPPLTDLTGQTFTVIYTFDATKGQLTLGSNISTLSGTGSSSPGTATISIGGGSFAFQQGSGSTGGSSSAQKWGGTGSRYNISDYVSQGNVNVSVYPALGTVLSSDSNWETAFSNSNLATSSNVNSMSFNIDQVNGPTIFEASGAGIPESITVSGPLATNPIAKTLGNIGGSKVNQTCSCSSSDPAIQNTGMPQVAEPISVATGNVFDSVMDYTAVGPNPLQFVRYYNSFGNSNGIDTFSSSLGTNWRSNYDRYLQLGASTVAAERPDGQVLTFTLNGSTWISDSDVDASLAQSGSTWTLTDHNDSVEIYNTVIVPTTSFPISYGQLASITTRNGYSQTLKYSNNQLSSVTDSYGRSLGFTYSSGGFLTQVTTPEPLILTYGTTPVSSGGNQLTSVSYNTNPVTSQTYLYENLVLPFALTGIQDENGNRYATWAYDAAGRAISSKLGTGVNQTTLTYNANGSTTVTNALGVEDTYTFQSLQGAPKLTQISRAATPTTAAATRTFGFDSYGYINSSTDWDGNQTTYTNNVHGDPTQINEAVGSSVARTTTITYDPTWVHLPGTIVTPGMTSVFVYDGNGNPHTRTDTDTTTTTVPYSTNGQTRVTTWNWTGTGQLSSIQLPRTDVAVITSYTYDGTGALTKISDSLGHSRNITAHSGGGLPTTVVDPNQVTTIFSYDRRLNLNTGTVQTAGGPLLTTWTHDAANELTSVQLPDNSTLTSTFDTAHRQTKVTDSLNNYITYTLDALGDRIQTSIYNPGGTLTWQDNGDFDALGRMTADTAGAGQVTTRSFDHNGNVLTVEDGLGHTTTNTYDALNRLSGSTDANGGKTTPAYDPHDRVISVADANNNTTSYVRDGFGDVIQQISPDSGSTVFYYDGDRNVTSKIDALGIVTNQTFDALDRRLTTTYPAHTPENVTYSYDQTTVGFTFGVGRLTSVADAAGALTRDYDERGNLTTEKRVNGATTLVTGYGYDGANRIASMTYPDGSVVTYQHDAAGYLTNVLAKPAGSSNTTTLATLTHQPFGPQSGVTYANGVAESWTYDKAYRPTNITDLLAGNGVQNLTYGYDNADNVSSIMDALNPANSQTLGYDSINRLVSAASGNGGYGNYSWTYDKVGNRLTQIGGSTITTYGYTPGTNRLASVTTNTAIAQLQKLPIISFHHGSGAVELAKLATPRHIVPSQSGQMKETSSILLVSLGLPMLLTGCGGVIVFRKRIRNNRMLGISAFFAVVTGCTSLLIGCAGSIFTSAKPTAGPTSAKVNGVVHGGQQPVTGATIQLYAVGTTGDGSAAKALISSTVVTDSSGSFSITSKYTCPSASTEVYLLATGGNPGLSAGTNNSAISMMAALGQCGQLTASTFVFVDEVTTVGSLAALYPYMTSANALGSGSTDAAQLASAFSAVSEYTNTGSGVAPGPALPAGYYASSREIDTLGNIVGTCINSGGGVAGDGSPCGNLFSLATPQGGVAPTDTIGAVLDILNNPSDNVSELFGLTGASVPFQPTLSSAPTTWNLPIVAIPATPTFLPAPGTYVSGGLVELDDTTPGVAIYYTTDGSIPTTNSTQYTGAITVASSVTIQAIATASGNTTSAIGSGTYTITGAGGNPSSNVVTVSTNANGNITSIPPANSAAYATFSYNNANRLASVTGSPMAATFVYDWAGQRFSKTDNGSPAGIYSYSQDETLIAENDGGTVTDYIYADGRPIAILQPSASPTTNQITYVAADGLGTPQVVTNISGNAVWTTSYEPFGSTGIISGSISQNLRFPGQNSDTETGFSYNINRDYMPNVGRYLETDMLGISGGLNSFAYVGGNPLRWIDPKGQFWPEVFAITITSMGFAQIVAEQYQTLSHLHIDTPDPFQPYWDTPNSCSLSNPRGAPTYISGQEFRAGEPSRAYFDAPEGDVPDIPEIPRVTSTGGYSYPVSGWSR